MRGDVLRIDKQVNRVSTLGMDDHQFKNEESETVGALSNVCVTITFGSRKAHLACKRSYPSGVPMRAFGETKR